VRFYTTDQTDKINDGITLQEIQINTEAVMPLGLDALKSDPRHGKNF
jgi:hypothetical protein